jgi:putative hydrolase of the HAD superfamily
VAAASELGMHTFCPQNGVDWTQDIYKYLKE